ncbi:hypothetical protein [Aestuariivirga sp.]|uniref:hypothetical protein n=1 Tax=Aestuariivirga sp. TaxID=2650926 RepID=UPI003784FC2B
MLRKKQFNIKKSEKNMGIDIANAGSFSWSSWHFIFELGLAFGWVPTGTEKPATLVDDGGGTLFSWDEQNDGAWSGGYFSNSAQTVTVEDAACWRAAIQKALACMQGDATPENDEQKLLLEQCGYGATALLLKFVEASKSKMMLL